MPTQTFFNLDETKRKAIIQAAIDAFSTHTFKETSVNVIVGQAGISKGSLYQYFDDKMDLYLYIIEYAGQVKLDYLQAHAKVDFDDFFEGMTTLMIHGTLFSMANPQYSRLLYKAMQNAFIDKSLARLKALNREFMIQLIRNAIEKGQIRRDVDVDIMVYLITVMSTEFAQYVTEKTGISPDQLNENEEALKQLDLPSAIKGLMALIKSGLAPVEKRR